MNSDTATDRGQRLAGLFILGLLITGLSWSSHAETTGQAKPGSKDDSELSSEACFEELDLSQLERALQRCNAVVHAHRADPAPLTDRSLLYILLGRIDQACRDVDQAVTLIRKQGHRVDPMVSHELMVRQASCKQRLSNAGKG